MRPNDPQGRALLAGTGWTLAVVGVSAFFKSAIPEPIYLWTAGVVAAGWAAAARGRAPASIISTPL